MRLTRVHVPGPLLAGTRVLPEGPARHLVRVLRLGEGDALRIFDGEGHEFEAVIESVRRDEVAVRIGAKVTNDVESPLSITLLQGVARGDKMDTILQKATELGVTRIVPLLLARSTVKLGADGIARRNEHWLAVIASACEQCGRSRLPRLDPAAQLEAALAMGDGGLRLLLAPDASAASLPALLAAHPHAAQRGVCLLVGPEGGFDEGEVSLAVAGGYRPCRLGPRVLRTETAGIAAITAVQVSVGDWR
jgi:16S rRNA (uracil1498-N3)-methyltransferase